MTLKEAIKELKSGAFWQSVDAIPEADRQRLWDAVDVALTCMESTNKLQSLLAAMDRLDRQYDVKATVDEGSTENRS